MVSKSSRGPGMAAGGREAEEALLLPEHVVGDAGAPSGNASVLGAVFNMSTSVVGTGIMSIPAAMRVLGVAPAVMLIIGVALLSNVSVDFMLRYTRGTPSYAALMGGSFGRAGAALLNVFIAFNCVGTLTVYLIIIGDVMSGPVGSGEAHAGGAAGVVRPALVDRPGCGAGGGRGDSPASCAPEARRFAEVHVGRVHPSGGGLHAHHDGDRGLHSLHRHCEDATDAPGLLHPRIPLRALHRRPGHRRRLHLPLQRAPHPRGAEQDVGHEVGGAHLARALLRHLRGGGLLRLPPLRGRHHARRARQLRPQLRLRRPAGAQRRRAPQLRAAPRARLPAPPLLAPRQRRRAPLPGPPPAGHRHAPLRGAHGPAHGGALRARHRHPQHLDALPVLRLHVRGLHIAHLPWRNCSQGCSWDSKEEGQGNGSDDDHSGSDHEQHRHCFQRHELYQGRSERC